MNRKVAYYRLVASGQLPPDKVGLYPALPADAEPGPSPRPTLIQRTILPVAELSPLARLERLPGLDDPFEVASLAYALAELLDDLHSIGLHERLLGSLVAGKLPLRSVLSCYRSGLNARPGEKAKQFGRSVAAMRNRAEDESRQHGRGRPANPSKGPVGPLEPSPTSHNYTGHR